jgi:ABC-type transport system involved in multi-copper enzyme maturation permease subunit
MSIHLAKYTRYEGPLESESSRFLVIGITELKRLLKQKWVRRFLLLSFTPLVVLTVMLYVGAVMKAEMGFDVLGGSIYIYFFHSQSWFIAVMMAAFGADLISKDIAGRSLCLYFTRSVGHMQYLWGKLLALGTLVLGVTLVPGLLLAAIQLALVDPPDLLRFLNNSGRVVVCSFGLAFMASSIILLLSSLGTKSRLIGIGWLALFFFLDFARVILIDAVGQQALLDLISIRHLMYAMAEYLFDAPDSLAAPSIALMLLSAFCFVSLKFRIQSLERRMT